MEKDNDPLPAKLFNLNLRLKCKHIKNTSGATEIQTTYFAAPETGPELQFALEPATEGLESAKEPATEALESANDPATEGLESVNEPATGATPEALELATEPPMTESPTTVLFEPVVAPDGAEPEPASPGPLPEWVCSTAPCSPSSSVSL